MRGSHDDSYVLNDKNSPESPQTLQSEKSVFLSKLEELFSV